MRSEDLTRQSLGVSDLNPSSEHLSFSRSEWAALRDATPLTLTEGELSELAGRVEPITLTGVRDIYLPLSRLLNLRVEAQLRLQNTTSDFFGRRAATRPFLIGVAGSVSAGMTDSTAPVDGDLNHVTCLIVHAAGFVDAVVRCTQVKHIIGRLLNPLKLLVALVAAVRELAHVVGLVELVAAIRPLGSRGPS